VIVDAHPREFIGVKLHQTVFLTVLDKYIGIFCNPVSQKLDPFLSKCKTAGLFDNFVQERKRTKRL